MEEIKNMLRAVINGQSTMKQELLEKIDQLDKKIDNVEIRLTKRLDKLGNQLAYLEDDTPTR